MYPEVAERVVVDHERANLSGAHDFVHAFRVGETARKIGLDEWGDTERISQLAGIAGLTHNADRVIQKELDVGRANIDQWRVQERIDEWIGTTLRGTELQEVKTAVLGHSEINGEHDGEVMTALKDADRVVNLDSDLFPRSGQHYADLPVIDYEHFLDDPYATYRNPKTVLRDINYSLDWIDPSSNVCIRTRLGREMGEARVKVFQTFFDALKTQLAEEGIDVPFTF